MAYDEIIASRIRRLLAERAGVTEQPMMGGLVFMVDGHMCCGLSRRGLLVRVGPGQVDSTLSEPYARPMEMAGRIMRGYVRVEEAGFTSDEALAAWISRALVFIGTLPARTPASRRQRPDRS